MRTPTEPTAAVDPGRREALLQIGRFAGYTAPTVMGLLIAQKAMAKSCRGIGASANCSLSNPGLGGGQPPQGSVGFGNS